MADNFHYIGGRCMVMRLVRDDEMAEKMQTDLGEDPLPEQEDGPVQELADDSAPAGDEEQVDLGTLEALLFSTHHPLTAGKLGELLNCSSTRPIRGVACGETIRSLMEKHLVKIAGRAEEPGRPILYGTTKRFLELFGLNSIKDLPQAGELTKPA